MSEKEEMPLSEKKIMRKKCDACDEGFAVNELSLIARGVTRLLNVCSACTLRPIIDLARIAHKDKTINRAVLSRYLPRQSDKWRSR